MQQASQSCWHLEDIQEPSLRGLQLLHHYATHPEGKIVSECWDFFRFLTQYIGFEDDSFGRLNRPRTEMPLVRREKPGPTDRLAGAERLNGNEALSRNVCRFQSDFTVINQIKTLRIVAFLNDPLAGPELLDGSAFNQKGKVLRRKVIPERMLGENIFERFHSFFTICLFPKISATRPFGLPLIGESFSILTIALWL
jgi:hypothetical protein